MSGPGNPAVAQQAARLLLVLALLLLLPGLFLQLAARTGILAADAPAAQQATAAMVAFGLAGLCIVGLAVLLPPDVSWRPVRSAAVLRAYLPFATVWIGFVVLYLRVVHSFGHTVQPQPQLRQLAEQGAAMPGFWLMVLGIVVIAPLAEEVVFRGYLLGTLLQLLPGWLAQLLTAAAFGSVHGADYALPIGCLGLLFGWLRARYRALWPSVLAHGLHNGITLVVTVAWPGHLQWLYPQ